MGDTRETSTPPTIGEAVGESGNTNIVRASQLPFRPLRSVGLLTLGNVAGRAFQVLFRILALRLVSIQTYGAFALVSTTYSTLQIVAHGNISHLVSTNFAKQGADQGLSPAIRSAIRLVSLLSAISAVVIAIVLIPYQLFTLLLVVLMLLGFLSSSFNQINSGQWRARGEFRLLFISAILVGLFRCLLILPVVRFSEPGAYALLVAYSLGSGPLLVFCFLEWKGARRGASSLQAPHVLDLPFLGWSVLADLAMAGVFLGMRMAAGSRGLTSVGIVDVALLGYAGAQLAFSAMGSVLIPSYSRALQEGKMVRMPGPMDIAILLGAAGTVSLLDHRYQTISTLLGLVSQEAALQSVGSFFDILLLALPFHFVIILYFSYYHALERPRTIAIGLAVLALTFTVVSWIAAVTGGIQFIAWSWVVLSGLAAGALSAAHWNTNGREGFGLIHTALAKQHRRGSDS